jgi:hypothetical protein
MARNATAFMVENSDLEAIRRSAGAVQFIYRVGEKAPIGMMFACPCGCGHKGSVRFQDRNGGVGEWTVVGEWPVVTMKPSIGFNRGDGQSARRDGYHWHGFLTNGVFEELG